MKKLNDMSECVDFIGCFIGYEERIRSGKYKRLVSELDKLAYKIQKGNAYIKGIGQT